MREVYLDNQSTTQIEERVYQEMLPYLQENYGNAQSMHSIGAKAKDALEKARGQVAELIGAKENEIYFTSCGSEANNLAVKGVAEAYKEKGKHIIVSGIEHFSVLYSARRLGQEGFAITYLPVDKYGLVSPEEVKNSIRDETILVSIQQANPEIGTIQPIEEIAHLLQKINAERRAKSQEPIYFHTDAVCTAGIIPVEVNKLGVDLLTLAGSQFYGPKGAAALYIKKGVRIIPQIDGGIQEGGRRAGTENIPAIVGFGKAAEIAQNEMGENYQKMFHLRDRLISELPKKIEYLYLNGHPEKRLPNNINFSVEFIEGEGMLLFLDEKGIYVSSGSACTSRALKMSHVLSAIELDPAIAQGSVLFTLSKYNTDEDIDYVLQEFPAIVERLRAVSPLYNYFKKTGKRKVAGPGTDYEHEHEE
ncbi:MAG TPA: cysteine desulfurase NifS [Elusimicrobia bacterium]|jgi:cysteine desulfurase|nr:cysteine desulfurase NifS [Elusimicrobiota bacterium]